jgi:hypothetical protein
MGGRLIVRSAVFAVRAGGLRFAISGCQLDADQPSIAHWAVSDYLMKEPDGMKELPADNFRGPVSWPSPTVQSEPSAKR